MKCEELSGLFELYALDALERAAAEEIDRHLAQRCEACMANLARAGGILYLVDYVDYLRNDSIPALHFQELDLYLFFDYTSII